MRKRKRLELYRDNGQTFQPHMRSLLLCWSSKHLLGAAMGRFLLGNRTSVPRPLTLPFCLIRTHQGTFLETHNHHRCGMRLLVPLIYVVVWQHVIPGTGWPMPAMWSAIKKVPAESAMSMRTLLLALRIDKSTTRSYIIEVSVLSGLYIYLGSSGTVAAWLVNGYRFLSLFKVACCPARRDRRCISICLAWLRALRVP
jgi:hypothetical protein